MKTWDNDALTAYLDNQGLSADEKAEIEQELQRNPDARIALALLRNTKTTVASTKSLRLEAPAELQASILAGIEAERSNQERIRNAQKDTSATKGFWQQFMAIFTKPVFAIPALALVILAVVIFSTQNGLLRGGGNDSAALSTDFCLESLQNFDAISAGKLGVQKATADFTELQTFFKNNGVGYEIVNPHIAAQLVGGVISEHEGVKLAHFVYKHNGSLVYLYEAPEALFAKHVLEVPRRLVPYVESGRWYTEHDNSNHSWMFWRVQTTYCTVVSDIPTEQLSQLFIGV